MIDQNHPQGRNAGMYGWPGYYYTPRQQQQQMPVNANKNVSTNVPNFAIWDAKQYVPNAYLQQQIAATHQSQVPPWMSQAYANKMSGMGAGGKVSPAPAPAPTTSQGSGS